jgi:hypothetical protein
VAVLGEPRVDHSGGTGEPADRDHDDVTRLESLEGQLGLTPPVGAAGLAGLLLQHPDLSTQVGVAQEVAEVALGRLGIAGERVLRLAQLPGEPDHRAVGLELGERLLEELPGPVSAVLVHQVDRHVVRRPEGGAERVGTGRREARQLARVHPRLPQDHRVALDVEPAASGSAGQLGVLPRRDVGVRLTVPLRQLLQHDRARRHVDPQSQGLGREHHLHQAAQVERLHALLERRQHACVVRGDAATQRVQEVVVAQHLEIGGRQRAHRLLHEREHLVALLRRVEPEVGVEALLHRGITPGPAEDEHDRGQQQLALEPFDHVDPAGDPHPAAVADAARVLRRPGPALAR